ncbi:MAG: type II secretion system minor pseudopilin GspI [Paracoccaceae bacterium]
MRLRRGDTRGFTLVELAVAILILSIAAIAAIRAGGGAQEALGGMQARVLARIVAENRAQELRAFGARAPLPETVAMGGQSFRVSVERTATEGGLERAVIVVRSELGPGARLVAFVRRAGAAG